MICQIIRITSYNVCYTKLLRAHEAGKGIVIVVNKWDLYEKDNTATLRFTVITSYSIHYTKLYESIAGSNVSVLSRLPLSL